MVARSSTLRQKLTNERKLRVYRSKRDFTRSPEPAGGPKAATSAGRLGFVVQKHAASRLHYDFRLELDGVLLSWAVPKGPTLAPGVRRLAMRTEDHPVEYATFEGVIPENEYGGGTVVVWDRGTWQPEDDPRQGLRRGRLTFELRGEKLRGRWHLVRTRGDGKGDPWLLFKGRDAAANEELEIVEARPESVVSGRSIEEVKNARDRVWHSNRAEKTSSVRSRSRPAAIAKRDPHRVGRAKRASAGSASKAERSGDDPTRSLVDLVEALPIDFPLTNLDKVLYPEAGFTKAALVAYLVVVAKPLLAQIGGRPLTLVRCPNGRQRSCFFQKHVKEGVPSAVGTVPIREDDGVATYMRVDDMAGLVALAQLGTLEIHTWGCHADQVEKPDQLVMDIDPDPSVAWDQVVAAAIEMRARLRELGLETFVKTTGGKGLHVVAPIERRISWDDLKAFAKGVGERLVADFPDRYTTNALKAQRRGKIFVDYLRNGRGATAIGAYSPRAREGATVAMPVTWHELSGRMRPADFTIATVPERIANQPDPWRGYHGVRQRISAAAQRKARG